LDSEASELSPIFLRQAAEFTMQGGTIPHDREFFRTQFQA